jgi:hypothetical protein
LSSFVLSFIPKNKKKHRPKTLEQKPEEKTEETN